MSRVAALLNKASRKEESLARSQLFSLLVRNKTWSYGSLRIRRGLWFRFLKALLHLIEMATLYRLCPFFIFKNFVFMFLVSFSLSMTWTSLLQPLRDNLNENPSAHLHRLIRITLALSSLLLVSGFSFFAYNFHENNNSLSIFNLYFLAQLLRITLDLPLRTLQVGLPSKDYPVIPNSLFLLARIVEISLILAFWKHLGPWIIPFACFCGLVLVYQGHSSEPIVV